MKIKIVFISLFIIATVSALIFVYRSQQAEVLPRDNSIQNFEEIKTGVGFHTKNGVINDLKLADRYGVVVVNAAHTNGTVPDVIKLAHKNVRVFAVNMAGSASNPEQIKSAYLELVRDYKPSYIGVGNEIERMSEKDEFVRIYPEIHTTIKTECGKCVVYPVFQYESFDTDLARSLPLDMLVFTSYPFSKYSSVNKIPDNYYQKAKTVAGELGVKVAFTEIGWPSTAEFGGSGAQQEFVDKFYALTSELDLQFVSWGLLYGEPSAGDVWADMGLLNPDGTEKGLQFK